MKRTQCSVVALIGRPNVGKSTLFNRLTRSNKAIVDPTPGVTRDRHYEQVSWNDRRFILVDTGGIELNKQEEMAGLIHDQSLQAIEEADILVFIMDGKEGLMSEDHEIAALLRKSSKPTFYLVNKIDGPELEHDALSNFYELGVENLWPISSGHGYGVRSFLDSFAESLDISEEIDQLPDNTIRLACIGRPNVGKSSLINRMIGENRMVVSEKAGTTRDSVDTLFVRGDRHFLFIDTAGIRRKGKVQDKLEKFSVMRALSALERCDVALILLDASEGITEQDTKIIGYALERGRACLVLVNKWDLVKDNKKKQQWILDDIKKAAIFAGFAPVLSISALRGSGIKRIFPEVEKIYHQYCQEFTTNKLNRVLKKAVEAHTPPLHQGKRLKLYYVTQVKVKPPTFIIFANYPKGIHFSYYRFLVNQFRSHLDLQKSPIKIVLKERVRRK